MSEPLIKGAVYELGRYGPAEYLGLDTFHGETTHSFRSGLGLHYIKPERLEHFLCPQDTKHD